MLKFTGKAGFPPNSSIFFSIFSAISSRGTPFFMIVLAYFFA